MIAWRERVRDEWIDYNGHLTEGYYGVVFGNATDAVLDHLGLDAAYREANDSSMYTVEAHVRFLAEVPPGVELEVRSSVIGVSDKLLRIWHEMWLDDRLCATQESLGLHVTGRRSAPFPDDVVSRIAAEVVRVPDDAGRSIRGG
ncbi:thioesterase family protein [Solicola gregarius]|uniref:Thioesterase family protein n=1 Tax=Solicola gregarius TaxID=2908642 RepID=A0AA46YM07_9ACTN|nr:thioesterase family protein [Solicola gregarius]UYM07515.1 thioesterase family protein [Solicola gregarius]